jgi:hypothetical protein
MSRLNDDQLSRLAAELAARLTEHAPGWTDHNDSDPGVTLLQAFAFLSESLLERANRIPDRARPQIDRTLTFLATLSERWRSGTGHHSLTRPNYFSGQLLTADDLRAEQDYLREKFRRHNRWVHGAGVVTGLSVTMEPAIAPAIAITPGMAITLSGEEIVVNGTVTAAVPESTATATLVTLIFVERPCDYAPENAGRPGQPRRIEEGFALIFGSDPAASGVPIARLVKDGAGWRLDREFQAPKAR